jgi:[ribosomal protein S5]-alanine N-acetyltransferase
MPEQFLWLKFSIELLEALINRDLKNASQILGAEIGDFFITDETVFWWNVRLQEAREDPRTLDWVARAVTYDGQVIGSAGFHGPPDQAGVVEVGYSVDPRHRQRGYAKTMLRHLLEWAASEPEVRTVRASIRPNNAASLATIKPFGFVGEQIDEIDGLEYVFEVPV